MAKSLKASRSFKTQDSFKSRDLDKKIGSLSISINVIMALIALIYVYLAYKYLANLKSCKCAEGKYVNKVKLAEGLIMGVILFWIIVKLWLINNIHTLSENDLKILLFIAGAVGIFTFIIYIYFCYYVNKMQKSLTTNCACAMKWQRWLVYIQYGFYLFEIILVILSVIASIIYMLAHMR